MPEHKTAKIWILLKISQQPFRSKFNYFIQKQGITITKTKIFFTFNQLEQYYKILYMFQNFALNKTSYYAPRCLLLSRSDPRAADLILFTSVLPKPANIAEHSELLHLQIWNQRAHQRNEAST
jgi:hypothetical protein